MKKKENKKKGKGKMKKMKKKKLKKNEKNAYIILFGRGRITSHPSSDWFNSYNLIG
jgi:predicted nucleotidyltransferase